MQSLKSGWSVEPSFLIVMKAVLVIVVNVLVSAAKLAIADECHDACTDVKNAVNAKSSCRPFRNSLPRPKVRT